jgi:hypothetical protein
MLVSAIVATAPVSPAVAIPVSIVPASFLEHPANTAAIPSTATARLIIVFTSGQRALRLFGNKTGRRQLSGRIALERRLS